MCYNTYCMEKDLELQMNSEKEVLVAVQPQHKHKLTSTSYALLGTHGFNYVVSVFVSTFLISYIYKVSTNYVLNIGLFYCFNYLSMGIFTFVISSILDKTNRVVCYRIAIIVRALFILALVFVGEKIANLVVLAGMLHGFSEACYWSSFNVMKNELVPGSCMKKYTLLQIIENKGMNFIAPIILGGIIDAESFKVSAIIIFIIASIQIVLSLFIKSKRPENSNFDLKGFFARIKSSDKNKEIFKTCFFAAFMMGSATLISPVNTIIIMLTFESNFSLGILTGVFSAISILMIVLAKKFSKSGKSFPIYSTFGVVSLIITSIFAFFTSKVMLVVFTFVYIAASTLYSYYFDLYRNVLLKKLDMYSDIAEYQCMIEALIELSRVIGFALMIVAGLIGAAIGGNGLVLALKVYLVAVTVVFALISLAYYKFEKKLLKHKVLD